MNISRPSFVFLLLLALFSFTSNAQQGTADSSMDKMDMTSHHSQPQDQMKGAQGGMTDMMEEMHPKTSSRK